MNVTMGLPRIIEILDGRKVIVTPMMEIYLQSPYNKGKDIKQIALSIKETTMQDVVSEFVINIADSTVEAMLDLRRIQELHLTPVFIGKASEKTVIPISVSRSTACSLVNSMNRVQR